MYRFSSGPPRFLPTRSAQRGSSFPAAEPPLGLRGLLLDLLVRLVDAAHEFVLALLGVRFRRILRFLQVLLGIMGLFIAG